MVGYSRSNPKRDGAWRRVVVRVTEPGATARTKQGYYATHFVMHVPRTRIAHFSTLRLHPTRPYPGIFRT